MSSTSRNWGCSRWFQEITMAFAMHRHHQQQDLLQHRHMGCPETGLSTSSRWVRKPMRSFGAERHGESQQGVWCWSAPDLWWCTDGRPRWVAVFATRLRRLQTAFAWAMQLRPQCIADAIKLNSVQQSSCASLRGQHRRSAAPQDSSTCRGNPVSVFAGKCLVLIYPLLFWGCGSVL